MLSPEPAIGGPLDVEAVTRLARLGQPDQGQRRGFWRVDDIARVHPVVDEMAAQPLAEGIRRQPAEEGDGDLEPPESDRGVARTTAGVGHIGPTSITNRGEIDECLATDHDQRHARKACHGFQEQRRQTTGTACQLKRGTEEVSYRALSARRTSRARNAPQPCPCRRAADHLPEGESRTMLGPAGEPEQPHGCALCAYAPPSVGRTAVR
jgi:hypothetical protein